jgi:hypothetical protein
MLMRADIALKALLRVIFKALKRALRASMKKQMRADIALRALLRLILLLRLLKASSPSSSMLLRLF